MSVTPQVACRVSIRLSTPGSIPLIEMGNRSHIHKKLVYTAPQTPV